MGNNVDKRISATRKSSNKSMFKSVLGAKAHSSSDALDVTANVIPIRFRIQEICTRDSILITRKPAESSVRKLLLSATVQRNRFTPMSYLKYIARDFHRSLGNLEIESESSHTSSNILNDTSVGLIPLAEDLAGAPRLGVWNSDVKEKTELILYRGS